MKIKILLYWIVIGPRLIFSKFQPGQVYEFWQGSRSITVTNPTNNNINDNFRFKVRWL